MFDGDFDKPKYFTLGEFRFTKGEVLEDVKVEYTCVGTPIVDDDGNITNAVVYCHGSSGDYGSIRRIEEISGKNEAFDTDKFFFISISALGSPRSLSPSSSNLKGSFPHYTIEDMVNFNRQFLKEKFNITHIKDNRRYGQF